jgi:antitoxin component of MazEF toxin-antitoxin module
MTRRKSNEENVRKIGKLGASYAITIPIDIIRSFKWQEKQKVVVEKKGKKVIISDWKG